MSDKTSFKKDLPRRYLKSEKEIIFRSFNYYIVTCIVVLLILHVVQTHTFRSGTLVDSSSYIVVEIWLLWLEGQE